MRSRTPRSPRSCACRPSSSTAPVRPGLHDAPFSATDSQSPSVVLAEDAIKAAISDYKKKRAAGILAAGKIDVSMGATGTTTAEARPGQA